MYAVDYPLNRGGRIYSPFRRGTVVFRGENATHGAYGKFVAIRASNGKYVSLSSHLDHIPPSIYKGKVVGKNTVIGYAGNTGGHSNIAVGEVNLHQAFYRYPSYNSYGAPYGGAGLKVARLRYSGTAARSKGLRTSSGRYSFARTKPDYRRYCQEKMRCGEGYRVGN